MYAPLTLLLALHAQAELRVGVLPFSGSSDANARTQATQILMDALAGMRGIRVVSFANIDAVLGLDAKAALEACRDDRCVVSQTSAVKTDGLLIGTLDEEGGKTILRVRMVKTSSAAETVGRVSREVPREPDALRPLVSQTALELFPEHAKESFGTLEIDGALPGARIVVDGKMSATVPLEATDPDAPALLRLRPGLHKIEVSAPGHYPANERAEVLAGQRTRLSIDLTKNRSLGPFILAGVGAGTGALAIILGTVARNRANDWSEACPSGGSCAPGYTRERYQSDEDLIDRNRTVANVLYGVTGAVITGAILWFAFDPGTDPEVEP